MSSRCAGVFSSQALQRLLQTVARRKPVEAPVEASGLQRRLSLLDLLVLGVGSTLGAGVYVLAGEVSREVSGPSVILSFLVAAAASALAGLSYAELGSRIPQTGSAYLYSYVALGELWAFVGGWNLLLSYVIGTSSVAKAWTGTFDDLLDNVMAETLGRVAAMESPGLAPFPDFFAAALIMLIAGILAFGLKESAVLNAAFTLVNVSVLIFIIIAGFIKGDINNWNLSPEAILNITQQQNFSGSQNQTSVFGTGGFFPFGVEGMLAGAATCFYAFVGFDCIATTGEEVQDPQKALPLAILASLLVCALVYCGVSAALTLLMPYFLLDAHSPLPAAFLQLGWQPAQYAVALGSLCALSTSLLGVMFPMPRVLLAMSRDGLLFSPLSLLSSRHNPAVATLCSAALAALMVLLLDLKALVDLSSMGTIAAYSLVSVCVLLLRFEDDSVFVLSPEAFRIQQLLWPPSSPTSSSCRNVRILTVTMLLQLLLLSVLLTAAADDLRRRQLWSVLLVCSLALTLVLGIALVWRQPQSSHRAAFMVPCVPLVPVLSVFVNTLLMVQMSAETWISYTVWMAAGLIVFTTYGVRHSKQRPRPQEPPTPQTPLNHSSHVAA